MSLRILVSPQRRVAARFVAQVRRALQKAIAETPDTNQSQIADLLEVNRSVISRQLHGRQDIGLSRVGEIAFALGYTPKLVLEKTVDRGNKLPRVAPAIQSVASSANQTLRRVNLSPISSTQTVRRSTTTFAEVE